jgi:urease accessory protein
MSSGQSTSPWRWNSTGRPIEGDIFHVNASRQAPRRPHKRVAIAASGAVALFVGSVAEAHMGTGLAGGFGSGFRHPFSGADHLLAMVSVGVWGAFLGRPLILALPVIFPAVMVAGAVMGMLVVPLPPVELGIALSVTVLGGCIALSVKAPVWVASLIVAIFAIFHGYAHGKELPSAADPVGYSLGFVLATGSLHVVGIGIGFLNDRQGGVRVTRSLGVLIAGAGVWFLCKAVAL